MNNNGDHLINGEFINKWIISNIVYIAFWLVIK